MEDLRSFNGLKVLVTGYSGFKGSWLVRSLYHLGAKVYGIAIEDSNQTLFDITATDKLLEDKFLLDINMFEDLNTAVHQINPDIVFHLAAQSIVKTGYQEPHLTFQTNVYGALNILECTRLSNSIKSLIYVTSDKCYDNKEWLWGYRENDPLGGHDPYSASKAAAELVCQSYIKSFFNNDLGKVVSSVRAGNVIGGGDWNFGRIIPDAIKAIESKSDLKLRRPEAVRPWQHVLEPVCAYLLLGIRQYNGEKDLEGAWNFGPSTSSVKTVKSLVSELYVNLGAGSISIEKEAYNNHEAGLLHLNCDKANQALNWYPKWDYEHTIKYTAEWYKAYLDNKDIEQITNKQIINYLQWK
ncbi:CDP-glucose 4,6-dehydratase [Schleiferiaceae bacterium]|nr:CDP-glucose 4,6-dehydratase [Schleiferiaceae bacterium]